jgi:hypothetical protein
MTFTLRARVRDGRLLLDEPVNLPEGTEIDLVLADGGDTLDDVDRHRLHAALKHSAEEHARGESIPALEVLSRLRR